jgi:hypothetical protein
MPTSRRSPVIAITGIGHRKVSSVRGNDFQNRQRPQGYLTLDTPDSWLSDSGEEKFLWS